MSAVPNPPRATVRLQLHAGFTLDDARATVPYHAALGISHLYASPLLAARRGSCHGYDVVDPRRINPELGGIDALRRLVATLRAHGMGLILDIVPNHMAASVENPWWRDVLEWGRASPYADYFDIDWAVADPQLRGRVLLPVLARARDDILAAGEIALQFDPDTGRLHVDVAGQRLPLAAAAYAPVLGAHPTLASVARRFADASHGESFESALAALRDCARTCAGRAALDAALAYYAAASPTGRARLDALLAQQPYLLAPWPQAWQRINWRRFFDVSDLVAIRPDRDVVFDAVHALVLELYAQGLIDGVRIDHIDGLVDPRCYCQRLRECLRVREPQRPAEAPRGPAYLIVEKILAADEVLRDDWPVDGATGYEFMDQVGALLHDPAGAAPLVRLWQELAGADDFAAHARAARWQMTRENFAADLDACARALHALAERCRATHEPTQLRAALVALIVHFPVYRAYASAGVVDPRDAQLLERAMQAAQASGADCDAVVIGRLQRWLSGDTPADAHEQAALAIARFQRLTPPIAAKAIEDTAFYRYGRLLSRNEVGSAPDRFALPVAAFHDACQRRRRERPRTLLATATHDHKRGEDARARLAVLSELPGRWRDQLHAWQQLNAGHRGAVDGAPAPDRADEAMLYQTLVGAWPVNLALDDAVALGEFAARIDAWQHKALREAKRHSSWRHPHADYEAACARFLQACLTSGGFATSLARFVGVIAAAGALNGLSQTLLRLTTPGIPDLYQGTEWWDWSLVDPDNRRPVDYPERATALRDLAPLPELLDNWADGRIKQQLIARVLAARAASPGVFGDGDYQPLALRGAQANHAIAFRREHRGELAIVIAPRLPWRLLGEDARTPHIAAPRWRDTALELPAGAWRDVVSSRVRRFGGGSVTLGEVLDAAPLALLQMVRE